MKRNIAALLSVISFCLSADAQNNLREKIFTAPANSLVKGLVRTYDGGYAIASSVDSAGAGNFDFCLLKLDASLQVEWAYTYGGPLEETCLMLRQAADSGFVLSGYSTSFTNGSRDAMILKTDKNGVVEWSRIVGGTLEDRFTWCEPRADGTITCAGNTKSAGAGDDDMLMVKLDANGDTLWTRIFGGQVYDAGICIANLTDGGYAMSGRIFSFGTGFRDACLLRTDANGNLAWFRTYGGPFTDEGMVVKQTSDGGFFMSGASESFAPSGYYDVYSIRTDSTGNLLWSRNYGGDNIDASYDFIENPDGGFTILGFSESFNSNLLSPHSPELLGNDSASIYLIRTNAQGDTLWTRVYGSNKFDEAYGLIPSDSGGYVIGAFSRSFNNDNRYDVYLLWVDSTGYAGCNTYYPPSGVIIPATVPMIHTPSVNSGIPVMTPGIFSGNISYTFSDPCLYSSVHNNLPHVTTFEVSPNPATDLIRITSSTSQKVTLTLTDITGTVIHASVFSENTLVNCQRLPDGIYFVNLRDESGISTTKKAVVIR
jgi:hypothetical protein